MLLKERSAHKRSSQESPLGAASEKKRAREEAHGANRHLNPRMHILLELRLGNPEGQVSDEKRESSLAIMPELLLTSLRVGLLMLLPVGHGERSEG